MAAGMVTVVWSPKGGVGKTLLSVALALNLAEREPTVLIDGNADNPDLVSLLQCANLPNIGTWPGEPAPGAVEDHLVRRSSRLFILPGPTRFVDEAVLSGEAMEAVLRSLRAAGMAAVVDCCTGLRDSTLVALDLADWILMPVTPDLLSLTPLKRVARELELLKVPAEKFRVVINRCADTREITAEDIRAISPFPVIGVVPSSRQAAAAINRGDPEAALAAGSPIGKAMAAVVNELFPAGTAAGASASGVSAGLAGLWRLRVSREGV